MSAHMLREDGEVGILKQLMALSSRTGRGSRWRGLWDKWNCGTELCVPSALQQKEAKENRNSGSHLYSTGHGCIPEPSLPLLTATHTPVLLFPPPSPLTWERWWVPGCSCCSNTFWMDSRDGRILEASLGTQTRHRAKAVASSLGLSHSDKATQMGWQTHLHAGHTSTLGLPSPCASWAVGWVMGANPSCLVTWSTVQCESGSWLCLAKLEHGHTGCSLGFALEVLTS